MAFLFGPQVEHKKPGKKPRPGSKGEGAYVRDKTAKREMSPNQIAAFSLCHELERYPNITKESRKRLKTEMMEMEHLCYMNMPYLAATLSLVDSTRHLQPTLEIFTGNLWQTVLDRLSLTTGLSEPSDIVKHKEQVLVYAVKVYKYYAGEIDEPLSEDEYDSDAGDVDPASDDEEEEPLDSELVRDD